MTCAEKTVVFGTLGNDIREIDLRKVSLHGFSTGEVFTIHGAHNDFVTRVASKGHIIASAGGSFDGTVKLWNDIGQKMFSDINLNGHVNSLQFLGSDIFAATASEASIFSLNEDEWIRSPLVEPSSGNIEFAKLSDDKDPLLAMLNVSAKEPNFSFYNVL